MPTPADYKQHWLTTFQRDGTQPVDLIASVSEDAINEYLIKHHTHDKKEYTATLEYFFDTDNPSRKFTLKAQAKAPVEVDLPPFNRSKKRSAIDRLFSRAGGWNEVGPDVRGPNLHVPEAGSADPNLRVYASEIQFSLSWPKLSDPSKDWEWKPGPISAVAEAFIELKHEQTPEGELRHFLVLQPTRMKFEKAAAFQFAAELRSHLAALPPEEQAALAATNEQFNDLLLIALNIVGTRFAPQLVREIQIPPPVVSEKTLFPAYLSLGSDVVTVGFSLDRALLLAHHKESIDSFITDYEQALTEDIEKAGGLQQLLLTQRPRAGATPEDLKFRSQADVEKLLVRSEAFVARACADSAEISEAITAPTPSTPAVPDGVGAAFDELLPLELVRGVLPEPKSKCSDWTKILDLVRGRTCSWTRLGNPTIAFSGTTAAGAVDVDVGGAIDACVRKFWDCSWHWSCGRVSLGIRGTPTIALSLKQGRGVTFYADLTGQLDVETNLPQPFKAVVEFFLNLIVRFVMALVRFVVRLVKFVIIPPDLEIPEQRTKIRLHEFDPMSFARPWPGGGTAPANKQKFIGYSIGVTAKR